MMTKNKQTGHIYITVLLLSLVLAVIGLIGWRILDSQKSSNSLCIKVTKDQYKPLQDCEEKKTKTVTGEQVTYLEITYGNGMDCPAGCIYSNAYLIVDQKFNIFEVAKKIEKDKSGKIRVDGIFANNSCPYNTYADLVNLEKHSNKYYWALTFNDSEAPQEFNNKCVFNGKVYIGFEDKKNTYYFKKDTITYKVLRNDCSDQDERHKRMCASAYAYMTNSSALCAKVDSETILSNTYYTDRNQCYYALAIRNFDANLCNQIINENYRDIISDCIKAVKDSSSRNELAKTF